MGRAARPVPGPSLFSTVGLPEERRIALWESHNAAALVGLNCRTNGAGPLEATEINAQAGEVHLARVTGTAHSVERNADVVRRCPADAIAVYITVRGDAWFGHGEGSRSLRPGHVLMCDADRPFRRVFSRGLEELAVKVPRAAFRESTGLATLRAPMVTDLTGAGGRNGPYARALAAMVGRSARAAGAAPADEAAITELVAVLASGRQAQPSLAHRAAARVFIEQHLTDRGLTASQVAAAIGISERHLSRVLAAAGTSFPRHVLHSRLRLAYEMLTAPAPSGSFSAGPFSAGPFSAGQSPAGQTPLGSAPAGLAARGQAGDGVAADRPSVAGVAGRCGFTSVTYFCHAFRAHFGLRASEVRSAAGRARQASEVR